MTFHFAHKCQNIYLQASSGVCAILTNVNLAIIIPYAQPIIHGAPNKSGVTTAIPCTHCMKTTLDVGETLFGSTF